MGMAIASMVMGLVGCFLLAPVGLILGIVSTVKAKRYPMEYGGIGFGIAGIILNSMGVLVFPIVLAVAIPAFVAARNAANESNAINTMRVLAAAESTYMTISGTCAELSELGKRGLVQPDVADGEKNGYRFMIVPGGRSLPACEIYGTPLTSNNQSRSFYISTEDGMVIHAAHKRGDRATSSDPVLEQPTRRTRDIFDD
jgi:type II secretory pathway pseudopilin PulG